MLYDKYRYVRFDAIVVDQELLHILLYIFINLCIKQRAVAFSRYIFRFKYIYIFQAIFYAHFYS